MFSKGDLQLMVDNELKMAEEKMDKYRYYCAQPDWDDFAYGALEEAQGHEKEAAYWKQRLDEEVRFARV